MKTLLLVGLLLFAAAGWFLARLAASTQDAIDRRAIEADES